MGQKLKLQQRADDEDDDEDAGEAEQQKLAEKLWGANKRNYYDADVVDPDVSRAMLPASACGCGSSKLGREGRRAPLSVSVQRVHAEPFPILI